MDLQIEKKRALVSASSAGIGFSIAEQLAREGATVYIHGRTEARVQIAIEKISKLQSGAHLLPLVCDLTTKEGFEVAKKQIDSLDILVNNLGIYEAKPFEELTDEDWLHIFNVNVLSGVRLSRHFLPLMLKANWGRIIFISSESAIQPPPEMIHYGVTKTAQIAIGRALAEMCAGSNVTVNSVLVGPTRSEGVETFISQLAKARSVSEEAVEKEFFQKTRPSSLIKRFETPDEVASVVTFLCSSLASSVTGAAVRAEGGVLKGIL